MGKWEHSAVFHEAGVGDDRNRDAFPVPRLCESPLRDAGLSRSIKRRVQERVA